MKIYKIVDNTNGNIYIGKTTKTLKHRLSQHKYDFKNEGRRCTSREIIKNGDYRIELIEETEDDSRERFWILNTDCINVCIPGQTMKEWREDNKEYRKYKKEYREKNKEKYKEYQKEYQKEYRKYRKSWGEHNNLLKIDIDIFS